MLSYLSHCTKPTLSRKNIYILSIKYMNNYVSIPCLNNILKVNIYLLETNYSLSSLFSLLLLNLEIVIKLVIG